METSKPTPIGKRPRGTILVPICRATPSSRGCVAELGIQSRRRRKLERDLSVWIPGSPAALRNDEMGFLHGRLHRPRQRAPDHRGLVVRQGGAPPMAKISLDALRTRISTVDRAKLDATTDDDIRRHKAEDGYGDRALPDAVREVVPPKALRIRLALTQQDMADALRIPVGTWRNWEQGRVALEHAGRSLLAIVQTNPEMALRALKLSASASRLAPDRSLSLRAPWRP